MCRRNSRVVRALIEIAFECCAAVFTMGKFVQSTLLRLCEKVPAVDSGYLCTSSLCAVVSAWLNASPRSQDVFE